jgi:hypothetical protein
MPPTFSAPQVGNAAQQYLHRARMFRSAATTLPDYINSEPNWPKYALLTHAIELSLKAFAHYSVETGKTSAAGEPKQHDLLGWYNVALQYGFQLDPSIALNLHLLNELHLTHYSRYPQDRITPLPDASAIADSTVDHLIFAFTQLINPR